MCAKLREKNTKYGHKYVIRLEYRDALLIATNHHFKNCGNMAIISCKKSMPKYHKNQYVSKGSTDFWS